jgi:amidase
MSERGIAMVRKLIREQVNFTFSKSIQPIARIKAAEKVIFETQDALCGTAPRGRNEIFPDPDLSRVNPVTGPVEIEGATQGDTLVVKIEDIKLANYGSIQAFRDIGPIPGFLKDNRTRTIEIKDGCSVFDYNIKLPIDPMVGTIGVAPAEGEIPTAHPGPHGGNMDNNEIKPGATVYLPVFVDGALFSLGDVHANMGDGELPGAGIDISADVKVTFDILKGRRIQRPIIETAKAYIVTSNASTFNEASRIATEEMIRLLQKGLGVDRLEAFWLIGAAGNLMISQACNGPMDLTLRLAFPKLEDKLTWKSIF